MRLSIPCCALVLAGCGAGEPDDATGLSATTLAVADDGLSVEPGSALAVGDETIAPARAAAVVSGTLPNPEHADCLFGTSDAVGDVALGREAADGAIWSFYSAAGLPLGTARGNPNPINGDELGPEIDAANVGFQIVAHNAFPVGAALIRFVVDGTRLADNGLSGRRDALLYLAAIPGGGVVASTVSTLGPSGVQWFDDRGARVGRYELPVEIPYDDVRDLVATDMRSHTLVLYPGLGSLRAQWLDTDGTPRGAEFRLALPRDASLSPLIGGGFAVRSGQRWAGRIASDATSIAPAPAWLVDRPRTRLVIVGERDLYALLFDDGETAPSRPQRIELRRANGAWAGGLVAWLPRGGYASQRTRIGRDGTLVQLFAHAGAAGPTCHYRYWPHLLRAGIDGNGEAVCAASCN